MSFIVHTDSGDYEGETLSGIATDMARWYVDNEISEPTVLELWYYEENRSAPQKELLQFEKDLQTALDDRRIQNAEDDAYNKETQPYSYM